MMTENEKTTIERELNHICNHKLFLNSPALIQLLKYLVVKTINSEELNEITIGSDIYGIDYSKNPGNSTVRSYMHKLRNKLEVYYNESKIKTTYILHIKKGNYKVSLIPTSTYQKTKLDKKVTVNIPIKFIKLLIGAVFLVAISIISSNIYISKANPIWEKYFERGASNMIVVSDQFMVFGRVWDGKMYGVTYNSINNHNDFIEYSQANPDILIKPADYTMMSKMAPLTIKSLSSWFIANNSDFNLQFESELKFEDINNHNILFVGQFKTMNISKPLFLKDSKVFSLYGDGFKYLDGGVEQIYNTNFSVNHTIEYAMVSFTSLSEGKSTLYFVSNNDIGVIATLRNFTNKKWLKGFYNQLPSKYCQFNALFEVEGIYRNDVSCKLVKLEVIE